jgi:hypothetical protein
MKKILFGLIATVALGFAGNAQENPKVELKFLKLESFDKLNYLDKIDETDFEIVEAEVISTEPIKFKSDSFTATEVKNACTQKNGYIYTLNDPKKILGIKITRGLWYDGGDCATWGTIITDTTSGVSVFIPADAATQFLMNVCGLSNIAKVKP